MKQLLSQAEAARRLGISRCSTLPALIASGLIQTVPWQRRLKIPLSEVERLCREGIPVIQSGRKMRIQKVQNAYNLDEELAKLDEGII